MNNLNWDKKLEQRFWSKVLIPENYEVDCWIWKAYKDKDGYGTFSLGKTMKKAHRLSYEYYKGEIKEELKICHSCDNPSCVNPNHLWEGSQQDNVDDCTKKRRNSIGSKHNNAILTENDVEKILNRISNGYYKYRKDIIKDFNISTDTIREILNGHYWKHVTDNFDLNILKNKLIHGQAGSNKIGSILKEDDVKNIKIDINNGILVKTIAVKYGVLPGLIYEIKAGRNWKHV